MASRADKSRRRYDSSCEIENPTPEDLLQEPVIKEHAQFLEVPSGEEREREIKLEAHMRFRCSFCSLCSQNWDWRFGETPDFEHHLETRFDWGVMDINCDSKVYASSSHV